MNSWKVIIVKNMFQMMSLVRSDRKMQENHLLSQRPRSDKAMALKIIVLNTNKSKCMKVLTDLVKYDFRKIKMT